MPTIPIPARLRASHLHRTSEARNLHTFLSATLHGAPSNCDQAGAALFDQFVLFHAEHTEPNDLPTILEAILTCYHLQRALRSPSGAFTDPRAPSGREHDGTLYYDFAALDLDKADIALNPDHDTAEKLAFRRAHLFVEVPFGTEPPIVHIDGEPATTSKAHLLLLRALIELLPNLPWPT